MMILVYENVAVRYHQTRTATFPCRQCRRVPTSSPWHHSRQHLWRRRSSSCPACWLCRRYPTVPADDPQTPPQRRTLPGPWYGLSARLSEWLVWCLPRSSRAGHRSSSSTSWWASVSRATLTSAFSSRFCGSATRRRVSIRSSIPRSTAHSNEHSSAYSPVTRVADFHLPIA